MPQQDSPAGPDRPRILIADPDSAHARALAEALAPQAAITATDAQAADEALDGSLRLVLAELRLPGGSGLALLEQCAARAPQATRVLLADHSEMPEIVRARAAGTVHHVVPRTVHPRRLRKLLAGALGTAAEASVTRAAPLAAQLAAGRGEELLRWTVEQLVRVPGVVIRDLARDPGAPALQLVFPSAELAGLRTRLAKGWPPCLKAANARLRLRSLWHPVVRFLGGLSPGAELYALPATDGGHAFLALFPWTREPRVTALVGFLPAGEAAPGDRLFAELHALAVSTVPELPLPRLPPDEEASGAGQPVLEYDWVVTGDYAGRDRRRRPTSFLNRFVFVGRRSRVPSRLRAVANGFVDRWPARVWGYALAYLLLSLVDTWLTFRFVRDGTVREMNPLLRPLLAEQPLAFLLAKNALALAGLFAVARFHLWRIGLRLLQATLLGYLALDGYWLWLLFT